RRWLSTRTTEMPAVDGFPRELLVQPPEARLAYFAAKVVAHPRLTHAHQAVRDALGQLTGASLVLVYGPTGVGKTTLRLRLEQQLIAEALPDLEKDPARVPVVAVEAVAPESGQFNWKDYYTRALIALAALTGTVHVLVGTYELLGLTNLSAQLSRRSIEIHFGRYRAELHDDRLAFKSVVLTFQRHLPVAEEPDLVGAWDALYEGSLGCVGVLKNWLNRALADALAHGAVTLTRRHLDRQALPTRTLLNLAREIAEGEAALREAPGGRDQLRSLLGLPVSMGRSANGETN